MVTSSRRSSVDISKMFDNALSFPLPKITAWCGGSRMTAIGWSFLPTKGKRRRFAVRAMFLKHIGSSTNTCALNDAGTICGCLPEPSTEWARAFQPILARPGPSFNLQESSILRPVSSFDGRSPATCYWSNMDRSTNERDGLTSWRLCRATKARAGKEDSYATIKTVLLIPMANRQVTDGWMDSDCL